VAFFLSLPFIFWGDFEKNNKLGRVKILGSLNKGKCEFEMGVVDF
jgi:hypothetical protein